MSDLIDMTGWVMSEHGVPDSRLTVLRRAKTPEHITYKHSTFWECQCNCGNPNTIIVRRDALIKGKTKSCGCLHDEKSAERLKKMFTKDYRKYSSDGSLKQKFCPTCQRWLKPDDFTPNKSSIDGCAWQCKECKVHNLLNRYKMYKNNANHRKIEFELSVEEFDNITKQPCYYCGQHSNTYLNMPFCGIDRINSNIGYVITNCVPCCETCNTMKSDRSLEDWIHHMQQILSHIGNKQIGGDFNV